MPAQVALSQATIGEVAKQIFASRRITRKDQRLLMSLLSHSSLGETEQKLVDRIYVALHNGLLQVVD